MKVVLDASALIACIEAEPGGDVVAARLAKAFISSVNYSEVIARMIVGGLPAGHAVRIVELLDLDIVDFDAQQGREAAALILKTKQSGLSLGDRACLALGIKLGCPVLTADRAWAAVSVGVKVELIR